MAPTLLQRLFNRKGGGGSAAAAAPGRAPREGPAFSWSCSELDLNEIRLIVYQDCERRGRQVLFDSKAVHKMEEVAAQRTEDLPAKVPAKSCPGGGPAAHGPSGGPLPHAKEQLPKYQVKLPL